MTNTKWYAIMKMQKGRGTRQTKVTLPDLAIIYKEDSNMKYQRTKNLIRGKRIFSPGVFSMTAKESTYPFVDKTRTMTGRVSENI